MKTWIRLVLVLITVGGGFSLFIVSITSLPPELTQGTPVTKVLAAILVCMMIGSGVLVTVSGLLFVHDPRCIWPMRIGLAIQIPWLSCPLMTYRMMCGAGLTILTSVKPPENVMLIGTHFAWFPEFGTTYNLRIAEYPWGFGINLVALFFFLLVGAVARTQRSSAPASDEPQPLSSATVARL